MIKSVHYVDFLNNLRIFKFVKYVVNQKIYDYALFVGKIIKKLFIKI